MILVKTVRALSYTRCKRGAPVAQVSLLSYTQRKCHFCHKCMIANPLAPGLCAEGQEVWELRRNVGLSWRVCYLTPTERAGSYMQQRVGVGTGLATTARRMEPTVHEPCATERAKQRPKSRSKVSEFGGAADKHQWNHWRQRQEVFTFS